MWTWSHVRKQWRFYLIILMPIVLLPIALLDGGQEIQSNKFKCAYIILLMAVFWTLEVLPLPVTALFPVVIFPFFGIQSSGSVASNYMKDTAMMFVGGITLALGIEYSGLHKRIALKIIITIGSSPWRILLGILVTSMTFSCFVVVNTAVAAMMVPIINGVMECFEETKSKEKRKKLKKLYLLAVAYAANIGGTATIIGSQPTLIYKELIEQENVGQDGKYTDLNFVTYIAFSMPIAIINLFFSWIILGWIFLGRPQFHSNEHYSETAAVDVISGETNSQEEQYRNANQNVDKLLRRKSDELGKISFHEWAVITIITIAVLLWLFRDPQVFPGWSAIFPKSHPKIGDSTIAVALLIVMFILPKEIRYFHGEFFGQSDTVLNWQYLQEHFPWHVIFIVGGGLAISDGSNASGLSVWLGDQFHGLENFSRHIILFIIILVISLLTEMMSNAAAVSLLTPILIALSKRLDMHPLYLSLPGAIACQYAFMLPTANPPNTIVFAAGDMRIADMAKPGFFLNMACLSVLYLMNISWGEYVIFDYSNYDYSKNMP